MPRLGKRRTSPGLQKRRERLAVEALEPRRMLADVSGTIVDDTVWTRDASPYEVRGDITVSSEATLTIEPGVEVRFDSGTGITVRGRLIAEGTPFDRITLDRAPGVSRWDGLRLDDTQQDNRVAFVDMHFGDGQGEAVRLDHARLLLDNVTWAGTTGTILELSHPSLIVRNSQFPTSQGGEIIHGEHITGDEYLIIEGNVFANSNNGGDVIDFLGADRPGPVLQVLNNVFLGGGDDGLDLDGTDALIEGNVFLNFRKNTPRATTANAIATGLPQSGETNRTDITVVRNVFVNNDHAILLKEHAFAIVENNVFIDTAEAVFQFHENSGTAVLGPGRGAELDGNIFWNNAQLFKNLVSIPAFRTELTVDRSLLPNELVDFGGTAVAAHQLGESNLSGDPLFVDAAGGDFRLQPGSPAMGSGPNRLDMGAYVAGGPSLSGVPTSSTEQSAVTLTVDGPGITHYRYRLNDEVYGPTTPVDVPITLTELPSGDYAIDVIGMNDAGEWFAGQTPAFGENHPRIITPSRTRTGEMLPMVVEVRDWQGQINALLTAPVTLMGPVDGTDVRVKKGVGSASPVVVATDDFQLDVGGPFSSPSLRTIEVLDATHPVQSYSGVLTGDIVWDATADRQITDDVLVPEGSTLTIEPGTRVLLGEKVNLRVEGQIFTQGTADDPIVFNSIDRALPWGGVELINATGHFQTTFFTNGGADTDRRFGHSESQPVILADRSVLDCNRCFILNSEGKGFGSSNDARVTLDESVVSDADTGGEFRDSIVHVTSSYFKNIPNDDGQFVDDDNDGLYFNGVHSSGEPSRFEDSFVITTKDDGLDHNGARLQVVRAWIEGAAHEGVAASNSNWVTIEDSVLLHNNQGVEAGYRSPDVTIRNSVVVSNDNQADPDTPITAGIRFGDGYDGRLGAYLGHVTAEGNVLYENGDNVRNFDGSIPGPKPGAVEISHSLTNDVDFDTIAANTAGIPRFGPLMHLLRDSAGFQGGDQGPIIGRFPVAASATFTVTAPAPAVRVLEVGHPRITPVDEIVIQFNQPMSNVDVGDMTLSRNDSDDLLAGSDAHLVSDDQTTFRLVGLGPFTQTSGRYVLHLNAAGSDIVNASGVPLGADGHRQWTTGPGDANQDGQFDQLDIVVLLTSAKFNTNQPATWREGDFDGDGRFETDDLVQSLVSGTYGQGPFAARSWERNAFTNRVATSHAQVDDDVLAKVAEGVVESNAS